jgi:hypothetical protein
MKAFLVTVGGFRIITAAPTAGAARYANYKAAREAEYRYKLIDFRVRRAPQFDALALSAKPSSVLGSIDCDGVRHGCLEVL